MTQWAGSLKNRCQQEDASREIGVSVGWDVGRREGAVSWERDAL